MKDFFNNVYKVLIEKRTDFSGRASRSEYWSSWLFIQLTSIFLLIFAFRARPLLLIFILFSILIIIPSFAVTVRTLHDVNKSGYWLIVPLPLIFISPSQRTCLNLHLYTAPSQIILILLPNSFLL